MHQPRITAEQHGAFIELCVLYPTGSLSKAELRTLRQHLEVCQSCRTTVGQYRKLDQVLVPTLVAEGSGLLGFGSAKTITKGKQRLLRAVEGSDLKQGAFGQRPTVPLAAFSLVCVFVIACGVSLGVGYRIASRTPHGSSGESHGQSVLASDLLALKATQTRVNDQLQAPDTKAADLSDQIKRQSEEIDRLKEIIGTNSTAKDQLQTQLWAAKDQQTKMIRDATTLEVQLEDARATMTNLQEQLRQASDRHAVDLIEVASLKDQVNDLSAKIGERDSQVEQQQSLLNSDRDIRELMGARDLFIADVFDIDRDGKTKAPFGRVFYTKNKSLIFYAFDLDKQRDLHTQQVAFQAWGLNDADKKSPRNLGIFYMDNQANRRWVLKFDNPAVLEKINSVFVTVEPSGGSTKPSGKQLLFAYLEAQPNHP